MAAERTIPNTHEDLLNAFSLLCASAKAARARVLGLESEVALLGQQLRLAQAEKGALLERLQQLEATLAKCKSDFAQTHAQQENAAACLQQRLEEAAMRAQQLEAALARSKSDFSQRHAEQEQVVACLKQRLEEAGIRAKQAEAAAGATRMRHEKLVQQLESIGLSLTPDMLTSDKTTFSSSSASANINTNHNCSNEGVTKTVSFASEPRGHDERGASSPLQESHQQTPDDEPATLGTRCHSSGNDTRTPNWTPRDDTTEADSTSAAALRSPSPAAPTTKARASSSCSSNGFFSHLLQSTTSAPFNPAEARTMREVLQTAYTAPLPSSVYSSKCKQEHTSGSFAQEAPAAPMGGGGRSSCSSIGNNNSRNDETARVQLSDGVRSVLAHLGLSTSDLDASAVQSALAGKGCTETVMHSCISAGPTTTTTQRAPSKLDVLLRQHEHYLSMQLEQQERWQQQPPPNTAGYLLADQARSAMGSSSAHQNVMPGFRRMSCTSKGHPQSSADGGSNRGAWRC